MFQDSLLSADEPVDSQVIRNVFKDCKPSDMFQHCKNPYQLNSFMLKSLNMIAPEKVIIGKKIIWSKNGELKEQKAVAYVIPFLKSLQLCLNNRDILQCVDNPRPKEEKVFKTVTDGHYYRNHSVYLYDHKALSIMIYYDDVEYCNPLVSKTHKLAMFYWVLLNIYPEFRSSLRVHNLLAVTKTSNLKSFGVAPVLESFIHDMQLLGDRKGVKLQVCGVERVFHGFVTVIAGDTPASALLGGFKEGVAGATHPCRRCMISKNELKSNFNVNSFALRDSSSHSDQLNILSEDLSPQAKTFWSMQFGINSRSCLLNLENMDVTRCLPHDFMHIVLEGVLESHITVFIKHCISEGKFTLNDLNLSMSNFDYKCFSKDKPSPILPTHLENGIRQNAAQMLCLGQILAFIVGKWLDETVEDHIKTFILLMQIINIALSYELHEDDVDLLNIMVQTHHIRFKALYGDAAITPKWHYMLHLPEQILLFGLPRQHWCMRLEALHSYFKNIASRIKNFKNLPFTFASRKQKLQCLEFAQMPGTTTRAFLYHGDIVSPGVPMPRDSIYRNLVSPYLRNLPENIEIMCSGSVTTMGFCFNKQSFILINLVDDSLPLFGKILEIVVWQDLHVIVYEEFVTDEFESKLNAYKVVPHKPNKFNALPISKLICKHPFVMFEYGSCDYVLLTYHKRTEFIN